MSYRNKNLPKHVEFDSDDSIDEASTEQKDKAFYRKLVVISAIAVACYAAYQYRSEISTAVKRVVSGAATTIHDMEASAFGNMVETPGVMDM